jgi:hypothetical protein
MKELRGDVAFLYFYESVGGDMPRILQIKYNECRSFYATDDETKIFDMSELIKWYAIDIGVYDHEYI